MKKILILLPKGFELLEAAAFTDVFGWARVAFKQKVMTVTCGLNPDKTVRASFGDGASVTSGNAVTEQGLKVNCAVSVDEVISADFEALALPGGFGRYGYYEEGFDERVLNLIRDFNTQKKPIASVCTASLLLAKSGILEGKMATTYRHENGKFLRQISELGAVACEEELLVTENIITSSGPATAPKVALKLLEMLTSHETAQQVLLAMGYGETQR
ncbi:MAG: DJ-1/PfpI family protein [Clostridiales Family XIII bacterium]|nr:DJ-1/PfpI family protein [Clostridiales Family XIII bacterium]